MEKEPPTDEKIPDLKNYYYPEARKHPELRTKG